MKNVFWIGGSSCSGKSTCAGILSQKHNLQLVNTDSLCFGRYMFDNPNLDSYKFIKKYKEMLLAGIDSFAETDVALSFGTFIRYCDEAFGLLVKDIEKMSEGRGLLVEGAHLLPNLLHQHSEKNRSIFLVSTRNQQRLIWRKEMNLEIPGGHPGEIDGFRNAKDKVAVENTRIEFHGRIADHIEKTSRDLGLKVVIADNNRTIDELVETIEEEFNLTLPST